MLVSPEQSRASGCLSWTTASVRQSELSALFRWPPATSRNEMNPSVLLGFIVGWLDFRLVTVELPVSSAFVRSRSARRPDNDQVSSRYLHHSRAVSPRSFCKRRRNQAASCHAQSSHTSACGNPADGRPPSLMLIPSMPPPHLPQRRMMGAGSPRCNSTSFALVAARAK